MTQETSTLIQALSRNASKFKTEGALLRLKVFANLVKPRPFEHNLQTSTNTKGRMDSQTFCQLNSLVSETVATGLHYFSLYSNQTPYIFLIELLDSFLYANPYVQT